MACASSGSATASASARPSSGRSARVDSGASSARTVTVKVEPSPGALSTPTPPCMASARRRTIERPSPVPPKRRVVVLSACTKGWNSRSRCSCVSPMPVSTTRMRSIDGPAFSRLSRTEPCSVNLSALPSRLNRICCRRSGSPITRSGPAAATKATSRIPLAAACGASVSATPSISSTVDSSMLSRSSRPDSILEKSRMSSMIFKSAEAE